MDNNVITWFQNVSLLFNYKGKSGNFTAARI